MSKHDRTTDDIMKWAASPDDPRLERAAKALIDRNFGDPALMFKVAALAMGRQEICAYPALVEFENDLYRELFSKERRASATNGELIAMGKLLQERKATAIALARENSGTADKPRLEGHHQPNGEGNPGVEQFSPAGRQRLRRLIQAEAADGPVAGDHPAPRRKPAKNTKPQPRHK